jgi:hypothetical protein
MKLSIYSFFPAPFFSLSLISCHLIRSIHVTPCPLMASTLTFAERHHLDVHLEFISFSNTLRERITSTSPYRNFVHFNFAFLLLLSFLYPGVFIFRSSYTSSSVCFHCISFMVLCSFSLLFLSLFLLLLNRLFVVLNLPITFWVRYYFVLFLSLRLLSIQVFNFFVCLCLRSRLQILLCSSSSSYLSSCYASSRS